VVAQRSASRAPQLLPPCGRALHRRGDTAGRTQSSAMCSLAGHLPPAPKAPNPRRVVRERAVDWVLDGRTVGESADALGLPVSAGFRFSPAGFAGLQNAVTCRGLLTRFRRAGLAGWQVYLRLPASIWSSQLNISTRILLNLLFRYLTPLFFNSR